MRDNQKLLTGLILFLLLVELFYFVLPWTRQEALYLYFTGLCLGAYIVSISLLYHQQKPAKGTADKQLKPLCVSTEESFKLERVKYLALQSQINPHFLYNTLESIRSEAIVGGVPSAAEMSELLADFFRYSISHMEKMVTVEEELLHIQTYFKIQKFRFGQRISLVIRQENLCEEIKKSRIPKLILQPFIENAIFHGLEPRISSGKITVRFLAFSERLSIFVSDDGVGISAESLGKLNNKMREKVSVERFEETMGGGLGIHNVNNRIRLLFGEDFGLHFYSKVSEGTDVEISLPLLLDGEKT